MKHLVVILVFAAALLACGCVGAVESVTMPPPTQEEIDWAREINARLDAQRIAHEQSLERQRWIRAVVPPGLLAGWAIFVVLAWRGARPLAARRSRVLLWTPCFLLAAAWCFPQLLLVALGLLPVLAWVWWKRALPWWEVGTASALYLPALALTWVVFRTLAAMGRG